MKNGNILSEIRNISSLSIDGKYFSRSMGVDFTVIEINERDRKLKLGIGDSLKEVNFIKFNRAYLKDGVIVN